MAFEDRPEIDLRPLGPLAPPVPFAEPETRYFEAAASLALLAVIIIATIIMARRRDR